MVGKAPWGPVPALRPTVTKWLTTILIKLFTLQQRAATSKPPAGSGARAVLILELCLAKSCLAQTKAVPGTILRV